MKDSKTNIYYTIVIGLLLLTSKVVEAKGKLIELDLIKSPQNKFNKQIQQDSFDPNAQGFDNTNDKKDNLNKQINHNHNSQKQKGMNFNQDEGDAAKNKIKIPQQGLRNIENNQYIVNIYIGSSSQKQSMLLDTGNPYTIVQGDSCDECYHGHPKVELFKCQESSTCRVTNQTPFQLQFVQGKAEGLQTEDQVCLENGLGLCTTKDFRFIDIYNITSPMKQNQAQGILGLGYLKQEPKFSYIYQLFQNGQIPEPSFSLYISDVNYDKKNQKDVSKLILGGIDMKYGAENANIIYHTVEKENQWALILEFVKFNEKSIKQTESNIAIIDSGSSNLVLPREDYNFLLKQLANEFGQTCKPYIDEYIQCSCPTGDISHFPDIKIRFGGVENAYTLNPIDYIIKENHLCNLKISTYTSNDGAWILGDVFLRKYMAYFNIEKETIGFILSNKKNLEGSEFLKDVMLILECFLGSLFLGILVIYLIRMISGLKNAKDEELNFN